MPTLAAPSPMPADLASTTAALAEAAAFASNRDRSARATITLEQECVQNALSLRIYEAHNYNTNSNRDDSRPPSYLRRHGHKG